MQIDKIKQLKAEILHKGKLYGFEQTVDKMVERIASSERCMLSCSDVDENSKVMFTGDNCWIQIGFKNRGADNLEVLWDVLHEYGHYLSGKPPIENGPGLSREIEAWEYALMEIKLQYEDLLALLPSFERYREKCLDSYRRLMP